MGAFVPARRARALGALLSVLLVGACSGEPRASQPESVPEAAVVEIPGPATEPVRSPDTFRVRFETSKGPFVVDVTRAHAPRGVDRFHELVTIGYFAGVRFFRVVPGFIVQFGIHGDPAVNARWSSATIPDEPMRLRNARGTIAFAAAGPNSRATQLFISTGENQRALDGQRIFVPFGTVVEGITTVDSLYGEYGEEPNHSRIQRQGTTYLQRWFPGLDSIVSATIVPVAERAP
jgi:cyclophilin family peptidyl-prolyl cis-trans isomerase